jgi:hypothetical protein
MDINPIRFADFAKMAAEQYVEKDVPLDSTIAKIAEKNNLSPVQIQRVVELTNLDTNERLFKSAGDKTFTFPLASLTGVQAILHPDRTSTVKTASVLDVLFSPPQEGRAKSVLEGIQKVASSTPFAKEAEALMEKHAEEHAGGIINELRKRIGQLVFEKQAAEDATHKAYDVIRDVAKNHILLEGGQLQDLMKYACCAFPKMAKVWLGVFEAVKADLTKLGHPVDKKILAQKIEIPGGEWKVINGRHAFQVDLDTFRRKISETDRLSHHINMLDDAPDPVEVGTNSFTDNMDTEQYLMSEVENLAKKASAMEDEDLFHKVVEIRKLAAAAAKAPAQKPGIVGKALSVGKKGAMIGGGVPLLAALLFGPSILKSVGRGFGRAFGREGRGGWSPEAQVQGPPAPMGMTYGHTGYGQPFQM